MIVSSMTSVRGFVKGPSTWLLARMSNFILMRGPGVGKVSHRSCQRRITERTGYFRTADKNHIPIYWHQHQLHSDSYLCARLNKLQFL